MAALARAASAASAAVRGYEILAREIHAAGIGTMFGVMGEANIDVVACLVQRHGLRYLPARTEAGAVAMAEGFAQASGSVGVATVTCGPGLTNTVTALTSAVRAQSQVLLITGQLPLSMTNRSQTFDQKALIAPTGAIVEQVETAAGLPGAVARALNAMRARRVPAVLNVLMPVLAEPVEVPPAHAEPAAGPAAAPRAPQEADLAALAEALSGAARPVILAGRGAVQAGAGAALVRLAERVDAALITSLLANGLFSGTGRDLGISGGLAAEEAIVALEQADVVAVFGASLNGWTTRGGQFAKQARIFQCDSDPAAAGRSTVPLAGHVVGDAKDVAVRLHNLVCNGTAGRAPWWRERGTAVEAAPTQPGTVDPRALCAALGGMLPAARSLVVDAGHFLEFPCRYITVPDAAAFNFTVHFGCVGLALATAIGAAVARPDRLAVAAIGDGGLTMSLNEIETAARLNIPLVILVLNDGAYGAEIKHLEDGGWPVRLARFANPDFAAVARALGAEAATVASLDDLARLRGRFSGLEGPLLIDARVDPAVKAEWMAIMKAARRQ